MSDVSARVIRTFVHIARQSKIEPNEVLPGGVSAQHLSDNTFRLPWSEFVAMLRRLRDRTGGLDGMEKLGEYGPKHAPDIRTFSSFFSSPMAMLRFGVLNWVPALLTPLYTELQEKDDRTATVTVKISPAYEDSPEYLRFLSGSFRSFSALYFDAAAAKVTPAYSAMGARYDVSLPAFKGANGKGRKVKELPPLERLAEELASTIQELAGAARRVSQQAMAAELQRQRLDAVAKMGEALAATADRQLRATQIANTLCSFDGCERVEIVGGDGLSASAGNTAAPTGKQLSRELKVGDRRVGELRMWINGNDEYLTMVIDKIRPWAAMGVAAGVELSRFEQSKDGDGFPLRFERAGQKWDLTERQLQVLALLVRGNSNKEIASQLTCAERTVEIHVTHLLRKSGAGSRAMITAKFWTEL